MDSLNYFNPYARDAGHEDQLTRAFLAVLRLVPFARAMFVDLIRRRQSEIGAEVHLPALTEPNSDATDICTQVSSLERYTGRLVSILITNEPWQGQKVVIASDRKAIYDGVISCASGFLLVIENKPRHENVWATQLDPNIKGNDDIEIDPNPVVVLWRDVIARLSAVLTSQSAGSSSIAAIDGTQATIVEDFLAFVWQHFPYLNPYDRFELCKKNLHLLRSRCRQIIEKLTKQESSHHRGWEDSVWLPEGPAGKATLHPSLGEDDNWDLVLAMNPGDTVSQARSLYSQLDEDALLQLAEEPGCEIRPNLHFSHVGTNLVWTSRDADLPKSLLAYVEYWKQNPGNIRQMPRDASNFQDLFAEFQQIGLISQEDVKELHKNFTNTERQHVRICPGIAVEFRWPSSTACSKDNHDDVLAKEIESRLLQALSVWGQEIAQP